ncbi:TPA: RcnB family protein [Klebsiella oxytoca]|uniref:RcnB family protein n=1 Tax=Klebsiella oxytoca TaxID=571 RepID=A0AAN5L8J9_KLEOX|nr:RcnB family protein [Klebsiella oxytoca]
MKIRILCLLLVCAGMPSGAVGVQGAGGGSQDSASLPDISRFELTHFIADYRYYEPGDIVPDRYLTPSYGITAWWLRNLPPPVPGSHWVWMDGSYVMVTNDVGVIIRAVSGDIFYRNRK